MDKWNLMHEYRRLVRSDKALPLRCPTDTALYAVTIDSHDEPVLRCYLCSSTVTPGLSLWKQIESAVNKAGE